MSLQEGDTETDPQKLWEDNGRGWRDFAHRLRNTSSQQLPKSGREAQGFLQKTKAVDPFGLNFWPLEPWENTFLWSPDLW